MNVLIVGCGNIGAFYDWETPDIRSYAKALYSSGIQFSVYDENYDVAKKVGERYGSKVLTSWDAKPLDAYDIVIIATPTASHFEYLCKLMMTPPKLIICEKPVSLDFEKLTLLAEKYQKNKTKVMVNFHRRFQPKIQDLAKRIKLLSEKNQCQSIVINYQRGFHNNAIHAIDLLSLFFGTIFNPSALKIINATADEFNDDPTITMGCDWNGINVVFVGLVHSRFSLFDISLFFKNNVIKLTDGANKIEFLSVPETQGTFYPMLKTDELWTETLNDCMTKVVEFGKKMIEDASIEDNFLESIEISKAIISIQREIKNE